MIIYCPECAVPLGKRHEEYCTHSGYWDGEIRFPKCKACDFINLLGDPQSNREYWIMTEIFVELHKGEDHCRLSSKTSKMTQADTEPASECLDCEKGTMKQTDLNGELVMKCSLCGFWMDYETWKDNLPEEPEPVDCPACDGQGNVVTPQDAYDCPNTECPSKKLDTKPVKKGVE